MIFCGIGESVVYNLLAALNLPSISPTTLKKKERKAGIAFEKVASETCIGELATEKRGKPWTYVTIIMINVIIKLMCFTCNWE